MLNIAKAITRLSNVIDKEVSIIVVLLLFLLSILLAAGVFSRYVLNDSIYWSGEVSRYILVYITFLGSTMAHKVKAHIRIDIFFTHLSDENKKIINAAIALSFIFFWMLVLVGSIKLYPFYIMQKTATLNIPYAVPFSALPISAVIWIIYCLDDILKELTKK